MRQNLECVKKEPDDSWDFISADTKGYTHGYHNYPAMMIPQIARRLINEYGHGANLLFDPYCGSGTSLIEARLEGINSIGTDLNPLARLLSKGKTTVYDLKKLEQVARKLIAALATPQRLNADIPNFKNIDYWFSPKAQKEIANLKMIIDTICPTEMYEFFIIPFSETVRESSYTRKGEFKLYRIEQDKIDKHNIDSYNLYITKLHRNLIGYREFHRSVDKTASAEVHGFNTCDGIPKGIFTEKVDVIVTSPPYGDSSTTVAYGQFSRLSSQWLGVEDAHQVDKTLMGGTKKLIDSNFEIKSAQTALNKIQNIDKKRYNEVYSFLFDYWLSIKNVAPLVRKGGYVCYVVGNRTVKNVQIPLDKITAEFFVQNGYQYVSSFERIIPNKRMPHKNSPSNIIGQLSTTMTGEHIVIVKKL